LGSLRTRIIAWSFIPTTIILLAVALVTFLAYQRVTEDLVVGKNRELTRLAAGQLAAGLAEFADILDAFGRTADVRQGNPMAQRAALARAGNRLVMFDGGVIILDTHGIVRAAQPARPEILDQDWSNRPYFRQLLRRTGSVVSDIVADGPNGAEVIVVAVPIIGDAGEQPGALAGMFRLRATGLSSFYGGIIKLRTGGDGNVLVVDGQGNVIYHPDDDLIGESLAANPSVQQVLAGRVDAIRTQHEGGHAIVASFAPVPGTAWGFVNEEPWDALMHSSQGYRDFLLVLLALGVVVPSVVVAIGVRRITRPIEAMISAARAIAGGNFGQKITAPAGDELAELAEQFNVMSAELQASYTQLERRVAERTRDLATLNGIAAVVSRSLDLAEILHDALDKLVEVMRADTGTAYRLEDDGRMLTLIAHRGVSPEIARQGARIALSASAAGQSAGLDRSLPGAATGLDRPLVRPVADYATGTLRSLLERERIATVISIPLVAKGQLLGMISLGSRSRRQATSEELALLAAVGHQVGVAMENARLYERAEESAAAAERNRLARDLHDAVTQTLFSASLIADVLPRIWERNPAEGGRRLEELRRLTRGALAEMRTLLLELRPAALTDGALSNLLRQLVEAASARTGMPIELVANGECPLPPDVQVALYRIAQEALNNITKHAHASRATVELRGQPDQVTLLIDDDGCGFDPARVASGRLGLGILRERADAIGATLTITSRPGGGTTVAVGWSSNGAREES
jgi:nitrate/nitrite-specific signal transduction histidine kinase